MAYTTPLAVPLLVSLALCVQMPKERMDAELYLGCRHVRCVSYCKKKGRECDEIAEVKMPVALSLMHL